MECSTTKMPACKPDTARCAGGPSGLTEQFRAVAINYATSSNQARGNEDNQLDDHRIVQHSRAHNAGCTLISARSDRTQLEPHVLSTYPEVYALPLNVPQYGFPGGYVAGPSPAVHYFHNAFNGAATAVAHRYSSTSHAGAPLRPAFFTDVQCMHQRHGAPCPSANLLGPSNHVIRHTVLLQGPPVSLHSLPAGPYGSDFCSVRDVGGYWPQTQPFVPSSTFPFPPLPHNQQATPPFNPSCNHKVPPTASSSAIRKPKNVKNGTAVHRHGKTDAAPQESESQNVIVKTALCRNVQQTGRCEYGARCHFAHNSDELTPRPANDRYKTIPCNDYSRDQRCPFGSKCHYIHIGEDPDEVVLNATRRLLERRRQQRQQSAGPAIDLDPGNKEAIGR